MLKDSCEIHPENGFNNKVSNLVKSPNLPPMLSLICQHDRVLMFFAQISGHIVQFDIHVFDDTFSNLPKSCLLA